MGNSGQRLLSAIAGILLGVITFYLFKGWYVLIPWSIGGILVGAFSYGRDVWVLNGAFFGYFLFLTYIPLGYHDKMDDSSLIHFIIFTICFSLVGGAAGIIGSYIGEWLKKKFTAPSYGGD